jgi:hypothetical protein
LNLNFKIGIKLGPIFILFFKLTRIETNVFKNLRTIV